MQPRTEPHLTQGLERRVPLPGWDLRCAFFNPLTGHSRIVALPDLRATGVPTGMCLVNAVPFDPSRIDAGDKKNEIDAVLRRHLKRQHEFLRLREASLEYAADQGEAFPEPQNHGRYRAFFATHSQPDLHIALELSRKLDGDSLMVFQGQNFANEQEALPCRPRVT